MHQAEPVTRTVVVAPDAFKGSASAAVVARALRDGWLSVRPGDRVVLAPMADGGEGTMEAFELALPASVRHPVRVAGPAGRPVDAWWLELPDGTAVVELAATSGIGLLPVLAPFDAHTLGFGQAIADALEFGATGLLLGIGGSASTDGGTGALTALGARFMDASGAPIALGNRGLETLTTADIGGLPALPPDRVRILSDVDSPLLGAAGAAAVFGPQKGATAADVPRLEAGLRRLAEVLGADPDAPGAGAAGGTGYGLLAWGGALTSGARAVAEAVGLPGRIASADLVITGEGRYDGQSETGKVPAFVRGLAEAAGVPALLVAGSIAADPSGFLRSVALTDLAGDAAAAIAQPERFAFDAAVVLAAGSL